MTNVPATTNKGDIMEAVIAKGDLSQLTPQERVQFYRATCESLGLNPLTQPFAFINLNGKLTLYARKDATDQLRNLQHVSIIKLEREKLDGIYMVTATAQMPDGRQDFSIGAVSIEGMKGDALSNSLMKAETKAKRRVTLSICGLGWADESETETIPGAQPVTVDAETGTIHWADKHTDWALKAAQKRSLTTGQVAQMIGDLHAFATPEDAVAALDAKLAEATK
jgi:hypothetical protein